MASADRGASSSSGSPPGGGATATPVSLSGPRRSAGLGVGARRSAGADSSSPEEVRRMRKTMETGEAHALALASTSAHTRWATTVASLPGSRYSTMSPGATDEMSPQPGAHRPASPPLCGEAPPLGPGGVTCGGAGSDSASARSSGVSGTWLTAGGASAWTPSCGAAAGAGVCGATAFCSPGPPPRRLLRSAARQVANCCFALLPPSSGPKSRASSKNRAAAANACAVSSVCAPDRSCVVGETG